MLSYIWCYQSLIAPIKLVYPLHDFLQIFAELLELRFIKRQIIKAFCYGGQQLFGLFSNSLFEIYSKELDLGQIHFMPEL